MRTVVGVSAKMGGKKKTQRYLDIEDRVRVEEAVVFSKSPMNCQGVTSTRPLLSLIRFCLRPVRWVIKTAKVFLPASLAGVFM